MSVVAVLHFSSGMDHDGSAPRTVDPEGRFEFGRNFPKMIDALDESARGLGITEPSQFVWENPFYEEEGLDELSEEGFEELQQRCDAMAKWIPIQEGIKTFEALASCHKLKKLSPHQSEPTEPEYYIAFEVACYKAALEEAAMQGEQGFHIQIL